MLDEFQAEVVLTPQHPLAHYTEFYLNGEKIERCFEARIRWASFIEPTFGEVIIEGEKPIAAIMRLPRLGEFDHQGIWAKFACGKVFVKLDDAGQKILKQFFQS